MALIYSCLLDFRSLCDFLATVLATMMQPLRPFFNSFLFYLSLFKSQIALVNNQVAL